MPRAHGRAKQETSVSSFEEAAQNDNAFIGSSKFTGVSSGNTITWSLTVPSSETRTVVIEDLKIESSERATAEVYDRFSSAPSGGTPEDPDAVLLDSAGVSTTSVADILENPSFTGSSTQSHDIIGSGSGGQGTGATGSVAKIIVEPDRQIGAEITNESNSAADIVVNCLYYERDGTFS